MGKGAISNGWSWAQARAQATCRSRAVAMAQAMGWSWAQEAAEPKWGRNRSALTTLAFTWNTALYSAWPSGRAPTPLLM